MSESKKEKRGEIVLHSLESFQRMALGFIPGGHIVEELLNFRSSLKQKRVLDFSESVKKALEEITEDKINPSCFSTEEFVDVMDAVFKRVQDTNSEIKLKYYKAILISQITDKDANEILSNKILQTIDELNDLQLILLSIISKDALPTIYDIHIDFNMNKVYIKLDKRDELPKGIEINHVLDLKVFLYFLEELVNKGLVIETETSGEPEVPLRELKDAYGDYIAGKLKYSNTKIVYTCSPYSKILCHYIENF